MPVVRFPGSSSDPNAITHVPLKIGVQHVGYARVFGDGTIEVEIHSKYLGKELFQHIQAGLVEGLTLAPIVKPAVDAHLPNVRTLRDRMKLRNTRGIRFNNPGQ